MGGQLCKLDFCNVGSPTPVFPQEMVGLSQFPTKTNFRVFPSYPVFSFFALSQMVGEQFAKIQM